MNTRKFVNAFTLLELLVVTVIVAVLAGVLLPAVAGSRTRSAGLKCLANMRQMQNGWAMYLHDNSDIMMPNAPTGATSTAAWVPAGALTWSASPPSRDVNTNVSLYTNCLLWPYIQSNITILKCPADVIPALDGPRLRSYSMNGQMGAFFLKAEGISYDSGFQSYVYGSDLVCPSPANAFIFLDEHPDSIQDGYLQINSIANGGWPDVPASYLEGACGFSFADGHGEIHQWVTTALLVPAQFGINFHYAVGGASNPDWLWFQERATCFHP